MNKEAMAYREIYEILNIFPIEFVALIPIEVIQFFCSHMDKEYDCHFEPETFNLNQTLDETKAIFTALLIEYWATDEQSEKLLKYYQIKDRASQTSNETKVSTSELLKKINEEKSNNA